MQIHKPHTNISFPEMDKVLCILQPIRIHPVWEKLIGGKPIHELNFNILTSFQKILLLKSRKQLLSANPRSVSYMLTGVREFIEEQAPSSSIDLLINPEFETEIPVFIKNWPQKIWISNKITDVLLGEIHNKRYDVIFLLYPDAIGLGWGNIENQLLSHVKETKVLIINGRGRIFIFDRDTRFALALRRFLDISCIVEIILFLGIFPVAIITAILDICINWKSKLWGESP